MQGATRLQAAGVARASECFGESRIEHDYFWSYDLFAYIVTLGDIPTRLFGCCLGRLPLDMTPPAVARSAPDDDNPEAAHPVLRPVHLTVWSALHDNGWLAIVAEQPDGTYAVISAASSARDVQPDAIATSADDGKAAAVDALRAKSGHDHCSPQCQRWQRERHLVMLLAEDFNEYSGVTSRKRRQR